MTTTARGSCVGPGITHLVSALIALVSLAFLIPAPPSSHGMFDAASAFACNTSGDTSGSQWASGALATDPPDSSDDDDDGPDGPDAAILSDPCRADNHQTDPLFDLQFTSSSSSVARDGHSLRAPPR